MRRKWSFLIPSPALGVAVAGLVIACGGVAYAATSKSSGVIQGCANKKNGALRLASKCRKGEQSVRWGVQGPEGLSGPAGPSGVQGAVGPQGVRGVTGGPGSAGLSGYELVTGVAVKSSGGGADFATSSAICQEGKSVLGGGFSSSGPENVQLFVREDKPFGTIGWFAQTTSALPTANYEITAWAVCAVVTT